MKEGVALEKVRWKTFYVIQMRLRYGDLVPITGEDWLGIVNGEFVQIGTLLEHASAFKRWVLCNSTITTLGYHLDGVESSL